MPASAELLALSRRLESRARIAPPPPRLVGDKPFVETPRAIPRDEDFREFWDMRGYQVARNGGSRTVAPDPRPAKNLQICRKIDPPRTIELQPVKHAAKPYPEPAPMRVFSETKIKADVKATVEALERALARSKARLG